MRSPAPLLPRYRLALAAATVAFAATTCSAIEMFTFFGDGSRIGLPSLEVPVEAYPGIPLRSDRLRARRRAMRMGPGSAVRVGPQGYGRGITMRATPIAGEAATVPAQAPAPAPAAEVEPPTAPEPEDLTPPSPRP